jgi:hypothetical protein
MEPAAALSLRQTTDAQRKLSSLRQNLAATELAKAFGDVKSALTAVDSSAYGVRSKFDALSQGADETAKQLSGNGDRRAENQIGSPGG